VFVAVADVNGDGKPDLAVVNGVSNSISVLLNTGAATSVLLAMVTSPPVSGPGTVNFANTDLSLGFSSVGGTGTATVSSYSGPIADATFALGTTPTNLGTSSWVITSTGLSPFSAQLRISLAGLPAAEVAALGAPGGITIYHRETPGSGPFTPLATTYDAGTNELVATVTSFSELVLGSGHTAGVSHGAAPIVLAIRSLGGNPSRGAIRLELALPNPGKAKVELFDVAGRRVESRELEVSAPGRQVVEWPGARRLAAGVYMARLSQGGHDVKTRIALIR